MRSPTTLGLRRAAARRNIVLVSCLLAINGRGGVEEASVARAPGGSVSPPGTALARRASRSLAHVPGVRCCGDTSLYLEAAGRRDRPSRRRCVCLCFKGHGRPSIPRAKPDGASSVTEGTPSFGKTDTFACASRFTGNRACVVPLLSLAEQSVSASVSPPHSPDRVSDSLPSDALIWHAKSA